MRGCCSCGVLLYCYGANVRGRIECCKSKAKKMKKKFSRALQLCDLRLNLMDVPLDVQHLPFERIPQGKAEKS